MARRSVLPDYVQAELPTRAQYGIGHDMSAPTMVNGEILTAYKARLNDPSTEMMETIKDMWAWLDRQGGTSIGLLIDARHARHPGCVTLSWSGGPSAIEAAGRVACGHLEDGTPQIPGWLSLKNEDDWDLRWQTTYGPILDPETLINTPDSTQVTEQFEGSREQMLLFTD